jgi:hypothetical protein
MGNKTLVSEDAKNAFIAAVAEVMGAVVGFLPDPSAPSHWRAFTLWGQMDVEASITPGVARQYGIRILFAESLKCDPDFMPAGNRVAHDGTRYLVTSQINSDKDGSDIWAVHSANRETVAFVFAEALRQVAVVKPERGKRPVR